jgi:hypothetical protein
MLVKCKEPISDAMLQQQSTTKAGRRVRSGNEAPHPGPKRPAVQLSGDLHSQVR